jgi:hypothetical protein
MPVFVRRFVEFSAYHPFAGRRKSGNSGGTSPIILVAQLVKPMRTVPSPMGSYQIWLSTS